METNENRQGSSDLPALREAVERLNRFADMIPAMRADLDLVFARSEQADRLAAALRERTKERKRAYRVSIEANARAEAAEARIATLSEALTVWAKIRRDFEACDGDRRGVGEALHEAEEALAALSPQSPGDGNG